jgi:hypothetical protein
MSELITRQDVLDLIDSMDNQLRDNPTRLLIAIDDKLVEMSPEGMQGYLNEIKLNDTNTDTKSTSDSDK